MTNLDAILTSNLDNAMADAVANVEQGTPLSETLTTLVQRTVHTVWPHAAKAVYEAATMASFKPERLHQERELQLMQSTPILREDAADRQQQRAGEGGA